MGEIQKQRKRRKRSLQRGSSFGEQMKREMVKWTRLRGRGCIKGDNEGNFGVNTVDMKIYRQTARKAEIKMHRWTAKMNRLID